MNWKGTNPEEWIHGAAVAAKQDYSGIVNDNTKDWFVKAAVSQEYADKWRAEVTPMTGKRLMDAQRVTAGYIQLWFDTYGDRYDLKRSNLTIEYLAFYYYTHGGMERER